MDKSWMQLTNRFSNAYRDGVREFLDFACENAKENGKIRCPCLKCNNVYRKTREEVGRHLVLYGIVKCYSPWIHHGEPFASLNADDYDDNEFGSGVGNHVVGDNEEQNLEELEEDDIDGILHDVFVRPSIADIVGDDYTSHANHTSDLLDSFYY